MCSKIKFTKLNLVLHLQAILRINDLSRFTCASVVFTLCTPYALAESTVDSVQMLQQQQQNPSLASFQPINLDELEKLPAVPVDGSMANEINQEAEKAKQQAYQSRQNPITEKIPPVQMENFETGKNDEVNVEHLMQTIRTQHDTEEQQPKNNTVQTNSKIFDLQSEPEPEPKNFFQRIIYKIKPKKDLTTLSMPKITTDVVGAPTELQTNIKNALSTFTQEAFEDYSASLPQIKLLTTQAAQAIGYYEATFVFKKVDNKKLQITVTPNQAVKVNAQNIEFSGAGARAPQFQVIRLIPDLDVGSILNQGLYEKTKARISDTATENGYFDAYWRLHDVKVQLPENEADVNLRYETGARYKLAPVEFRMSDDKKELPLKRKVLESMVPWKDGDDYAFWRVNTLANNLTNSRYFNWSLVDTVKPNPINVSLELPPDIQTLVDQRKITKSSALEKQNTDAKQKSYSSKEVTQNVVDEDQFAGANNENAVQSDLDQDDDQSETDQLKAKARQEKKIPVIVTLNADRLNSAEVGVGYGTDTGPRLRTQYRRAIVNRSGHAFDANFEVSQIRQAIDTHYTIPYKNPLNNYFNILSGYEREKTDGVGPGMSLTTESVVTGVEHIIRNPIGGWQHTYGVRYRLDKIEQIGDIDSTNVPDAFLRPGSSPKQQSLLLGYQLSRKDINDPVNPVRGFKQNYKIQLGSQNFVSDANMAIANIDYGFIYSLGENNNHQFLGGASFGYIFTDDFSKVPYNLRFFAGGDQSLRGFDYKSLAPQENGYKIGGQALAIGSLEYNYQFKPGWRAAVFSDFGNAYDADFKTPSAYSAGVGIRWQSPIGPIRLDVASGISDPNRPIRLHFFIGSQL